MQSPSSDVTRLLLRWSDGDADALEQLVPLIYGELKRIASNQLRRERPEHTLAPTALVHELYLRLVNTPDASGVFHANDEGDERVNDIVMAIAGQFGTPPDIRRVPLAEARQKMGPYADALALDQKVRSPRAKALGWTPSLRSVSGNVARLLEEQEEGGGR